MNKSEKKFETLSLKKWYEEQYSKINVSAVPGSMTSKILHRLLEKPFKSNLDFSILEVGGNNGEHLEFVSPDFRDYILTDIRKTQIKHLPPRTKFIKADVQKLPFTTETFDRTISTCLFHHINDPVKGFLELRRVTKVGGTISILIPNDPGMTYRFLRLITSKRKAKASNLLVELNLIHALEHRNHFLQLRTLLKHCFDEDEIRVNSYPFLLPGFNLNALTTYHITKKF